MFTYMVALNTNVINFGAKHTGKVVGLLNAFFAGSPSVFATVYYKLFTDGDPTVVENQNFGSFMIFFAVMYGIADFLCMIFLRVYSRDNKQSKIEVKYYNETNGVVLNGAEHNGKADEIGPVTKFETDDSDEHMSLKQIACNIDFLSFALMFAFVSSVGLVYTNNITVVSRSVGLNSHNDDLVIIIPITNAIVSASIGILSDILKDKIPRLVLVTGSCFLFVLSQVLIMANYNLRNGTERNGTMFGVQSGGKYENKTFRSFITISVTLQSMSLFPLCHTYYLTAECIYDTLILLHT